MRKIEKVVKVSAIRQVSIPKEICEELNIGPGDRMIATLRAGKIILEPSVTVPRSRVTKSSGSIKKSK